uniref:Uncharacterized protein n=1 Tax=Tetranychus urticae TaxID=32264 RepID=T1K0L6_TETUR
MGNVWINSLHNSWDRLWIGFLELERKIHELDSKIETSDVGLNMLLILLPVLTKLSIFHPLALHPDRLLSSLN